MMSLMALKMKIKVNVKAMTVHVMATKTNVDGDEKNGDKSIESE